MQQLTDEGARHVAEIAQRYGVSTDAAMTLLQALVNSNGTMAQFYHPELGGGGQWMRGGMTMVGDMFNYGLKQKVDGLCSELSQLLANQPFQPSPPAGQFQYQGGGGSSVGGGTTLFAGGPGSGQWWPPELGAPNGSGSQNYIRYAYFNGAHRLAVELNGQVTVYDTLDHQIGGVSQQQGSGGTLTFTSQYGQVNTSSLPIVSPGGAVNSPEPRPVAPAFSPPGGSPLGGSPLGGASGGTDVFAAIERLAELQQKGILSAEEFSAKKAELLSRL